MKNYRLRLLISLLSLALAVPALGDQLDDVRTLRDTTINLLNALVEQGVLTREKADALIKQAEQAAANGKTPATPPAATAPSASPSQAAAATGAAAAAAGAGAAAAGAAQAPAPVAPGTVRVPYVPEAVKEEIRDEVKQDVLAQAKAERWGEPGAFPDWVNHITWYGDVRVRYQGERFPTNGVPNATPEQLALPQFGAYVLTNTSEPVNILRMRARFGLDATIGDWVTAGIRLASGGVGLGTNGASESQTLGNYTSRESVGFDLAYLTFHPVDWFSVTGGRLGNPFFHSTTLVWANDLSLEGVVAGFTPHFGDTLNVFVTAGLFPILDVEPTPTSAASSKWLYGYQAGFHWQFAPIVTWHFGAALYDYRNIEGIANPTYYSTIYSGTAAPFRQDGNSVFDINALANAYNGTTNYLIGLVSKFHEANASSEFDFAFGGRPHVMLDLDFVKNLGFDHDDIYRRTGLSLAERTTGVQVQLKVGDPNFTRRYNWQGFVGYRYAQRDSVVDAFTDADFNLGGTNAQGYILGGEFAFETNSTLRVRWFSSRQIDGLPLAINLLQVDASTAF
jgi:hypothetical protein